MQTLENVSELSTCPQQGNPRHLEHYLTYCLLLSTSSWKPQFPNAGVPKAEAGGSCLRMGGSGIHYKYDDTQGSSRGSYWIEDRDSDLRLWLEAPSLILSKPFIISLL